MNYPLERINSHILPMKRRIEACIDDKGGNFFFFFFLTFSFYFLFLFMYYTRILCISNYLQAPSDCSMTECFPLTQCYDACPRG